jgi:hypothetical protein
MTKRPPATRKDHQKFCETEGWQKRKTAKGKTGTHHVNYELPLGDGRILYTRISHPVDKTDYGKKIWASILREQLDVTSDEFWDCVTNGQVPSRGAPPAPDPAQAIPAPVVAILIGTFGIPEVEVRTMTKDQALLRLSELYSEPKAT